MKKGYFSFLWNFQSIISLLELKLELNKRMRVSDDEQCINKVLPDSEKNVSVGVYQHLKQLQKTTVKNT